jgi:hypothetical protein
VLTRLYQQNSFPSISALLDVKKARLAKEEEFGDVFPDCEIGAMPPYSPATHAPGRSRGDAHRRHRQIAPSYLAQRNPMYSSLTSGS